MSDEALRSLFEGYWAIATIAAIGLAGIIMVLALLTAWRRFMVRRREAEQRRFRRRTGEEVDLWQMGGQRLASMLVPPKPPSDDATLHFPGSEDEDFDEDDEDEDDEEDDREWWQRGGDDD